MADGRLFSVGGQARLYIARQNSRPPQPSAVLRPLPLRCSGAGPARPTAFVATKAAMGAADPEHEEAAMTTDDDTTGYEPPHASSPTDHLLTELQLYGHRPFQDEPDPRPLPDPRIPAGAVADIFDALIVSLDDTRLQPDRDDLF